MTKMKNNKLTTDRYDRLLDRFFDGDTAIEEERQLYRYFRSDSVSARHERYRGMFAGFAAMSAEENTSVAAPSSAGKTVGSRRVLRVVMAVAASLLCVVLLGTAYSSMHERQLERLYGGSYVIEDGRRIDNLCAIRSHIEKTLAASDAIERDVEQHAVIKNAELDVLRNIDDPAARDKVMKLLNDSI